MLQVRRFLVGIYAAHECRSSGQVLPIRSGTRGTSCRHETSCKLRCLSDTRYRSISYSWPILSASWWGGGGEVCELHIRDYENWIMLNFLGICYKFLYNFFLMKIWLCYLRWNLNYHLITHFYFRLAYLKSNFA